MKNVFCTICCTNYLPKAITLAESLKNQHPDTDITLCLVEKELPSGIDLLQYFDDVVLAKDIFKEYFEWFIFKYDQLEGSTFVKARYLRYLLNKYDRVIYLDPDIYVYSPLEELLALDRNIIVTPHQINPVSDLKTIDSSVIGFLLCGIFNLGFISINNSKESLAFLSWWENKLEYYCFLDFNRGLFTDQKWIDLAFILFEIFNFKNYGYNVANWNINERHLSRTKENTLLINNYFPLRFFHYSSVDSGKDLRIFRLLASKDSLKVVKKIRNEYKKAITSNDRNNLSKIEWSYNYFNSGERINKLCRTAFFKNAKLRKLFLNPFDFSNEQILSIGY